MPPVYDLIVVGGGISGSSAAKVASDYGLKVVVIEKENRIVSPPKCAEGVFSSEFTLLFNPRDSWINAVINRGILFSPMGRKLVINYPKGGFIIDRTVFDVDLQDDAMMSGVEFLFNCRVSKIIENGDVINVSFIRSNKKESAIKGRFLIGADGPLSLVGRRAYLIDNLSKDIYICYQYRVYTKEIYFDDEIYFYVDPVKMPYSYGWVFPKGEGLYNIGVATMYEYSKRSPKIILDNLVGKITNGKYEVIISVWGAVPIGFRKLYNNRRILLVGDAGSLADTFTGAGICSAIKSGRWAGKAVYNFLDSGRKNDIKYFYIEPVSKYLLKLNKRLYMIREKFYKLSQNKLNALMDSLIEMVGDRDFKDLDMQNILYNLLINHSFPFISTLWRWRIW
ncbi:MAG: geranylgeranyl reductase family protein [bacterium]